MRDLQRYFQGRQRGDVQRVGVDDAVDVRAGAIDPAVEAIGRIRHAVPVEDVEVFVDQQQVAGADLVEAQAQLLGVVGPRLRAARGDLPGEPGVVAGLEENPAGQGQLLPVSPRIIAEAAFHLLQRVLDQLILG